MVIWLEDLLDEQDDAEAVSEGKPVSERQPASEPERGARDGVEGPPTRTTEDDTPTPSPDEDRTVDLTDRRHDPALSEAAIADDDGWSLLDIDAARFTRH